MIAPTRGRTHLLVAVWLLVLALLGSGCVSIPTTGPIEKVSGAQPECQNCVNVEVAPPSVGDDPRQIVDGYLRANSTYQPSYSVARQFLSRSAAEKWSPEAGVSIYRGSPVTSGSRVTLEGRLVGSLERDRTYTARDQRLLVDFGLVRENGEWRIGTPPPGLLVAEFSFTSFYQPYEIYFVGAGSALVPDTIYLPVLRNPPSVASALTKALLAGPSAWLQPAVTSAIPPSTRLSVDSVTITDGIADVPLSDSVLELADSKRSLLAAQLVTTLSEAVGVKGVRITVNEQKFRIPEADPNTLVVSVDAISTELNPVPVVAGDEAYLVRNGVVESVDPVTGGASTPVDGPLGQGVYNVDSLAASVTNTDLGVVTDDRAVLRRAEIATGRVTTLMDDATDLLRPQFSRYGELWAIGRQDGRQRLWRFDADGRQEVPATFPGSGEITAFKISPDGTRMAVVRRTRSGSQLGLMRIRRSDKFRVDGWRVLDLTQTERPQVLTVNDVAWVDASQMMVLGQPSRDAPANPFRVGYDAASIVADGETNGWDAVEVSVLLRTGTPLVLARGGQTWTDDGTQWLPFLDEVTTIAYAG